MTNLPPIVRTIKDLRTQVKVWKSEGLLIGLVPTMGALHRGHLSLVDEIAKKTDRIIVSIFVNPTQFGKDEDLEGYPRNESEDMEKLSTVSCHLVFAPDGAEMYPEGYQTSVHLEDITHGLEGAARPGHFDGMATIVSKLLNQSMPDMAIFGEKDYQQLQTIKRFVRDLDMDVKIIGSKLIREDDGLAMSSRNAYLNMDERIIAGQLNKILKDLVQSVNTGENLREAEARATELLLEAGFTSVEYVSVRDAENLNEITDITRPARVLAVACIGKIRLLDNMVINYN